MSILYDILIEPFIDSDIVSLLIGVVMWIFMLMLFGLLFYGVFYLVDYVWLEEKESKGIVVEKIFIKEHTTTSYVYINKVMVPQIHHYDDEWLFKIEISGKTDEHSVSKKIWDRSNVGDMFNCVYTNGRLTGNVYIKNILIAEE